MNTVSNLIKMSLRQLGPICCPRGRGGGVVFLRYTPGVGDIS